MPASIRELVTFIVLEANVLHRYSYRYYTFEKHITLRKLYCLVYVAIPHFRNQK